MAATDRHDYSCDLCKVTYSTDNDLQDHNWSLMHHIKIEKIKKGAPHSCNLCMESCSNLIEYGKHLNEDRHKLALSRRGKEGTEILDSFSSQNDLFNNDFDDAPVHNQVYQSQHDLRSSHRGRQEFRGEGRSINKHSRSFSQPELFKSNRPDQQFRSNQNPAYLNGNSWQPVQHENPTLFKKPRGRGGGHSRTQSDWRYGLNYGQADPHQQAQFHYDDFQNINWNDNNFYNDVRFNPYQWNRFEQQERTRRGSFEGNVYRNNGNQRYDNRTEQYKQGREDGRSRQVFRSQRGRGRAHSYDNNSPESTSSSDSGLKRRLENDDRSSSGKSRRCYSPEPFSATTDSSILSDSRFMTDDDSLRRNRSRSASRDRFRTEDRLRSRVESIERPSSRNSDKKVSWSDQHQVSSTTDLLTDDTFTVDHGGSGRKKQQSQLTKHQVIPDSSSESESSKSQKMKIGKKKLTGLTNRKSSPKSQRKNQLANDQTETVLEKAEKLCKKLRNDREKAKQKKQAEEKKKKIEKHREINEKLETLKERSNQHITGVLESQMSYISGKDSLSEKHKPERRMDDPDFYMMSSAGPSSTYSDIDAAQLIPERLTSTPKPTPTVSSVSSQDSVKKASPASSISQRISQTKADIDAIRAKIESSVNKGVPTPSSTSSDSTMSPSRHLLSSELSSPVGRYPQKAERNSLRKMVNSPRTTKERLQLAEMLREHAKSQKKLSLHRFNINYSDLCNNSDRQDEQVNIDTLAPSVQLEIANIIEADVKPDIAELEKLLDLASAGNCELDVNILSDLGVSSASPVGKSSSTHIVISSPEITSVSTPIVISSPEVTSVLSTRSSERSKTTVDSGRTYSDLSSDAVRQKKSFLSENELLCQKDKDNTSSRSPSYNLPEEFSSNKGFGEWMESSPASDRDAGTSHLSQEIRTWNVSDRTHRNKRSANDTEPNLGLSVDDLRTGNTDGVQKQSKYKRPTDSNIPGSQRFSSSLPTPSSAETNGRNLSSSVSGPDSMIKIKEEKIDDGYDKAVSVALNKAKTFFRKFSSPTEGVTLSGSDTPTEETLGLNKDAGSEVKESRYEASNTGRFSPVRKSIHTQKLFSNDDIPVKDMYRSNSKQLENDSRSTLEKVTSILDGVPAPKVETGTKSTSVNNPVGVSSDTVPTDIASKEKHLDSSQHSQSSILDEIYNVSVSEESVRQEISTVDIKISKLKSLIEEASMELNKCAEQKNSLQEKEQTYRTKRLKLLEESRSSSACSQASANLFSAENLSRIQDENPVLLKFLLSQRHSDLSSVGGFSNVETGSQPDTPRNSERRGSLTSNVSEPVSLPAEQTGPIDTNALFSQSIGALSGSSESLVSVFMKQQKNSSDNKTDDNDKNVNTDSGVTDGNGDSINASNSISLLKNPLEKVGFVTLDALMRGDTDIGRLLNKSLESIEKGTIPEGASPLLKQSSNDSSGTGSVTAGKRERHDSTFSLDTGSDSEKKSLSLKYMGTLPEGTNYESLMRQVSYENKNKSVMFTVFSSPEAMSQLRRNPDAGSTPTMRPTEGSSGVQTGYKSDDSSHTNSTRTLTHYSDVESQSVKSGYSLGEQIKRICDEQNPEQTMEVDMSKPSDEFSGIMYNGIDLSASRNSPVKDCFVKLDRVDAQNQSNLKACGVTFDSQSPVRKRLKSKKERDQLSRRKQKETFILQSDTNSEAEIETSKSRQVSQSTTKSEDDMVQTGSEDRTPRPSASSEVKKSLLDEVQLETETHSDSCEDSQKHSSIQYKGPALSVACVQEFKGDLYVCYNGSELRRFDLKTGRILKELDCSPYLVNCLHVTSVDEVGDVLYTGGTCKKLMTFEPQKFNLISTSDYMERITCLHEDWGRLFIGFSDGGISVRSLKSDKELNNFSCTTSSIHCIKCTSAGMTKMLCLATADKVIYILDAITGLLITMLEGHTQPPLCLQISGDKVISGGADQTMMIHSSTTGELMKMSMGNQPITHTWYDGGTIYAVGCDNIVRTYNFNLKPGEVLQGNGKSVITCGMTLDKLVILGKRDGSVEALSLDKLNKSSCQKHVLQHTLARK